MTSYKKLGEKIRRFRKERRLTQEQLAEVSMIDPKSIIQIEIGKRNPTLKTLSKISKALKIPLSKIIE